VTDLEYETLRYGYPHLRLPPYDDLSDKMRGMVSKLDEYELITRRATVLLAADNITINGFPLYPWSEL
jgi:hypothetical protein